ncbi:MAG: membrane dipeptidase [Alphaproteobacteria bacterium]
MTRPTPDWRAERPWLADVTVCDSLLSWTGDLLPPGAELAEQLKRYHESGFDHVSLTLAAGVAPPARAVARFGHVSRVLAPHAEWVCLAHDRTAIEAARAAGKLAVSFNFQAATPFDGEPELVDGFMALGVTRAIIAYNQANLFGDGCHEPRNGGLTAQGRDLIARMDAVGMRVDVSHCGERTARDVLDADLQHTPIVSHSNARALYDHERNITDELIRAAGERGCYIGVNGVGFFLGAADDEIPVQMARHAAHIAGLAGADKVGLGLDFMYLEGSDYGFFHAARGRWPRGYPDPPWSFAQPEQLGAIVVALETEGFERGQMKGLLGGNYLRYVPGAGT